MDVADAHADAAQVFVQFLSHPLGQGGHEHTLVSLDAHPDLLEEIISRHTEQPIERIHKDTDRDFILSAQEAKEYGIIDEVISVRESAPADAAATAAS
jgi:hypothetical protein